MGEAEPTTFGQVIAERRKELGLTLREATSLFTKEDGEPISHQYLSDLENDRRSPPSDHLIEAIAKAYNLSATYLYLKARRLPPNFSSANKRQAVASLEALLKELKSQAAA